eukprot:gene2349-2897_t
MSDNNNNNNNNGEIEQPFAQQILEQLSENVSQLILMVIVLQEQNAALPIDELTAVLNGSASIAEVSVTLANEEYNDFPHIQNEIISASQKMEITKNQAFSAIRGFNLIVDRKEAWNTISDSCRSIANETMNILELVYDADIKRLITLSDLTLNQLKELELNYDSLETDPKRFADLVSDNVSRILKVASFSKISNIPEPIKLQLNDDIDQLDDKGNQLINIVNDLLDDPVSIEKKDQFFAIQSQLKELVQKVVDIVKRNSTSLRNNRILSVPQQQLPSSTAAAVTNTDSLLDEIIRGTSKGYNEFLRASYRADSSAVNTISTSLEKLLSILKENLNRFKTRNRLPPSTSQLLDTAIQNLESNLPKFFSAGTDVVNNPLNTHFINKLVENLDGLQEQLQTIASISSSKDFQVLNAIKSKEEILKILEESFNNPAVIVGTLKTLTKNQSKLEGFVDPDQDPAEITAAVNSLSVLLPKQIQAAKVYLKEPNNQEYRQSLEDICKEMKVPLTHIVSLMEPSDHGDAGNVMVKEIATSSKIIEAAKAGDTKKVESLVKELENTIANLVSITTAETLFTDPATVAIVKEFSDQLLAKLCNRRKIATDLSKSPNDQDLQDKLLQLNQEICGLSIALTDSIKSDMALLQLKLSNAAKSGDIPSVESLIKEITNKVSASVQTAQLLDETLKDDPIQLQFIKHLVDDLTNFIGLEIKECKAVIPSIPNDPSRIIFLGEKITNSLSELQSKLKPAPVSNPSSSSSSRISSGELGPHPLSESELIESELRAIQENKESERKRKVDEEMENQEIERGLAQNRILTLINELLAHIKNSEANKSLLTLKQIISEQDKLLTIANDLVGRTLSVDFKEQIEYSISLFKQSIGSCIQLSGKITRNNRDNPNETEQLLNKSVLVIKKSIIELDHLLQYNPDIEMQASHQLLLKQLQSPMISAHATNTKLLKHFKDNVLSQYGNEQSIVSKLDQLETHQQSANVIVDKAVIDILFEMLRSTEAIVKSSLKHQKNSRYHIQTAFQIEKLDLISLAIQKIVYHQTELLKAATDYLQSTLENIDPNLRQLLLNSINTVQGSLIQQVESALEFFDSKNKDEASLDKLLVIIDTVRESVEHIAGSIFSQTVNGPVSEEKLINQSISSLIPTLSVTISKLQTNPDDQQSKETYDQLIQHIVNPLESLSLEKQKQHKEQIEQLERQKDEEQENNLPETKIKQLVQEEKELLDRLLSYTIDSDTHSVVGTSRSMVKAHQELVALAEATCSQLNDPLTVELVKETCKELTQLIPQQLSTIKSSLQSNDIPSEVSLQQKASHISSQIKRNVDFLENTFSPSNQPEARSKQFKKLNHILDSNPGSGYNSQNVRGLEKSAKSLVKDSSVELATIFDPEKQKRVREAIQNLEDRLQNRDNGLSATVSKYLGDPSNSNAKQDLVQSKNQFLQSIDRLTEETSGTTSQLLKNHLDIIHSIVTHSVRGSFNKIIETAKHILSNQQKLKTQIQKEFSSISDQAKKHSIQVSLNEMDILVPEIIKASKDLILNPADQKKRDILENLQTKIEAPIANIYYEFNPSNTNYTLESLIKSHQSTLIKLDDCIKLGRENEFNSQLKLIESIQSKLSPFIKDSSVDETLKNQLDDLTKIVREYFTHLSKGTFTPTIEAEKDLSLFTLRSTVNHLSNTIDKKIKTISSNHSNSSKSSSTTSPSSPKINEGIQNIISSVKSNNFLPNVKSPETIQKYVSIQNKQSDPKSPIFQPRIISTASVNLNNNKLNLNNNNNTGNGISKPTTVISKASINIGTSKPTVKRIPLKLAPSSPNSTSPPNNNVSPRNSNQNLEDSFLLAAKQIEKGDLTKNLAKELESFAFSIKNNQRQQMVICGRNIFTLITEYCNEIQRVSKLCTNSILQSKMIQGTHALKTLSCQIKILSGVKATNTNNSPDPDSDNQLASLVNLLSSTIHDINTSVNTHSSITSSKSRSSNKLL